MTSDSNNDLDWSAFCYLADEMSPAEAAAFEDRLATDQPAREALAKAVELTQLIAAADSSPAALVSPPRRHTAGSRQRLTWIALAGLACSVLVALCSSAFIHRARQAQLAAAWSETQTQMQAAAEPDVWALGTQSPPDLEDELVATSDISVDEVMVETPSWLDAAVAGAVEDSSGD
jgi:hypothetical protein